eukprot:9831802-Alexandrium_andersonii.AAC.1
MQGLSSLSRQRFRAQRLKEGCCDAASALARSCAAECAPWPDLWRCPLPSNGGIPKTAFAT